MLKKKSPVLEGFIVFIQRSKKYVINMGFFPC